MTNFLTSARIAPALRQDKNPGNPHGASVASVASVALHLLKEKGVGIKGRGRDIDIERALASNAGDAGDAGGPYINQQLTSISILALSWRGAGGRTIGGHYDPA